MSCIADIETRVSGIPCIVRVTYFKRHKGSFSFHAPSDLDYWGYTESEWHVLDRRGRQAAWLEKKLTAPEVDRIEQEIAEALSDD